MKTRILTSILALSIFSSSVIAKEIKGPTIEATVSFINQVLSDSSKSSNKLVLFFHEESKYSNYLKLNYLEECKFDLQQVYHRGDLGKSFIYKAYIDLSKHKIYLNTETDSIYNIKIKDRKGIKTIHHITYDHIYDEPLRIEEIVDYDIFKSDIYGVYKEKVKKALDHLSNICYKKYGGKEDDPF